MTNTNLHVEKDKVASGMVRYVKMAAATQVIGERLTQETETVTLGSDLRFSNEPGLADTHWTRLQTQKR